MSTHVAPFIWGSKRTPSRKEHCSFDTQIPWSAMLARQAIASPPTRLPLGHPPARRQVSMIGYTWYHLTCGHARYSQRDISGCIVRGFFRYLLRPVEGDFFKSFCLGTEPPLNFLWSRIPRHKKYKKLAKPHKLARQVLNFNMKSHGTQPCTSAPAALKKLPRTDSFEFPGPIIRLISTGQDNTDKLPSRPKRIVTSPRRHSVVLTRAAQLAEQEPPRLSKSKSFCGPLFARIESE